MNRIYLLIGSNLGNKSENLRLAIVFIRDNIGSITRYSSVYESEPWGFSHNQNFYNQVIEADTDLSATDLLRVIQKFEKTTGKITRTSGYLPRYIDIDILFFNNEIINLPDLIVPHPRIQERNFVLVPLAEIIPDFVHPALNTTISHLAETSTDGKWVKKSVK